MIFSRFLIDCSQLPVELMVSFNDPRILGLTFIRYKSNTIDFVIKGVFCTVKGLISLENMIRLQEFS